MEQKILDTAGNMFLTLGYKSVTMDDIAQEMAISKKTLYKYFKNKEELVEKSTVRIHQSCLSAIDAITQCNYNPIRETFEIKSMFREMFINLSSSPLFQLKKYYPRVYAKVMETEVIAFSKCIENNIQKGIEKGFYRKDLNIAVCIDFYLSLIFNIHDKDISSAEVLALEHEALLYHTRAIATEKGLHELDNQLKNTHQ